MCYLGRIVAVCLMTAGMLYGVNAQALTGSSVYIQNNTNNTITLKTVVPCKGKACKGKYLNKKYWSGGQKAVKVGPWQRVRLFKTNRDSGIKNNAFYYFNTTIKVPGWKTQGQDFLIQVKLEGASIFEKTAGSWMWQGIRNSAGKQSFYKDPKKRNAAWVLKKGSQRKRINVKYWSYFTGGDDNIEFAFQEAYPAPIGQADKHRINVLNWNIYMRQEHLFHNGQSIRAGLIPAKIRGYDAVVFQEAFDNSARRKLMKGMCKYGYKYATKILGKDVGADQDGGVIIASRWPIRNQDETVFKDCSGWDCKAQKGVVYAKIDKRGRSYHVFGTHMNNGDVKVQDRQLKAIRRFVQKQKVPKTEAVLLSGDMNINRYNKKRFKRMLTLLNAGEAQITPGSYPFSHDGRINRLYDSKSFSTLDYVLYSKAHLQPNQKASTTEVQIFTSSDEWKEYGFEKAYWDLSDHFSVFGGYSFDLVPNLSLNMPPAKDTLVPIDRYWNSKRKEIAEVSSNKRRSAFKKAGYRRVGTLGWAFRSGADASRYANNLGGAVRKIGNTTAKLSFYVRKTSNKKSVSDFFTDNDRYRKYKTHDKAVYVYTRNALVAWPKLAPLVVPAVRYYNRKTKDNSVAVSLNDHRQAKRDKLCLTCGPKVLICGSKDIKKALGVNRCAIGYLAKTSAWSKRRCTKDSDCDSKKNHICLISKSGGRGRTKRVRVKMGVTKAVSTAAGRLAHAIKVGVCAVRPPR
jgi:endonuclease/exonuclease/phosphatase family metal-dependent hydrolase